MSKTSFLGSIISFINILLIPALCDAKSPFCESSKTTACSGLKPPNSKAFKNTSGSGL